MFGKQKFITRNAWFLAKGKKNSSTDKPCFHLSQLAFLFLENEKIFIGMEIFHDFLFGEMMV